MRALVIDDSRAIRQIVGKIMNDLGYETSVACHGLDGLKVLEQMGVPDVILVDWNMPEMNGIEFIRAVRQIPAHFETPIIMVTTETEMERMAEAFIAGVNEYIMKPFNREVILEKLQLLGIGE